MRIAESKTVYEETGNMIRNPQFDLMESMDGEGSAEAQGIPEFIPEKVAVGAKIEYRDMTEEEEAEMLRQQAEMEEYERNRPLTAEERMEILEDAFAELCEVVL